MRPDNESRRFAIRSASAIRQAITKQHKPFRKVTNRTAPNASKNQPLSREDNRRTGSTVRHRRDKRGLEKLRSPVAPRDHPGRSRPRRRQEKLKEMPRQIYAEQPSEWNEVPSRATIIAATVCGYGI
jgi:hypothetical protein